MKRIIVNADDFGASVSVNRGIIRAHEEGVVSSTTIMANMPAFRDAVRLAKRVPSLGVGVHCNLIDGKPFVLDSFGRDVVVRAALGLIPQREIEEEFREQFSMVDRVLPVTHADAHQHVGVFPRIRGALMTVAKEFGVRKLRLPLERDVWFSSSLWKLAVVNSQALVTRMYYKREGFLFPEQFFGLLSTGRFGVADFERVVPKVVGTAELCVHPGVKEERVLRGDFLEKSRPLEFAALVDPRMKEILSRYDVSLVHYGDI